MAFPPPFGPWFQTPPYSWSTSASFYGMHPGGPAPSPPPPYSPYGYGLPAPPAEDDEDEVDHRYKTPDIQRIRIHLIKIPANAQPSGLFSGRRIFPKFEGYKLPLSMSISDFFKEVDAFKHKNAVIEEAVEEGNGAWIRGAKLYWGCQEPSSLGEVQWRRGNGLSAASKQVVWVLVRPKTEDDT